jgi:hypothetical protein
MELKTIRSAVICGSILGLLISLGFLIEACGTMPPIPDPVPAAVDAGPPDVPSVSSCMDACSHGEIMGCPWAQTTSEGRTCTEACVAANRTAPWSTGCIEIAGTCDLAVACQRR